MDVYEHVGTVTKKGQVTIPLSVRKLLGVKAYDKVAFRVSEGRIELLPAHMSLEAAFGAVRPRSRPEDWKAASRLARDEHARRRLAKTRARRRGSR